MTRRRSRGLDVRHRLQPGVGHLQLPRPRQGRAAAGQQQQQTSGRSAAASRDGASGDAQQPTAGATRESRFADPAWGVQCAPALPALCLAAYFQTGPTCVWGTAGRSLAHDPS